MEESEKRKKEREGIWAKREREEVFSLSLHNESSVTLGVVCFLCVPPCPSEKSKKSQATIDTQLVRGSSLSFRSLNCCSSQHSQGDICSGEREK